MSFRPRPGVVFMSVPTIVPTMVNFTPVSFAPAVLHTITQQQAFRHRAPEMRPMVPVPDPPSTGPIITVFVGNISERAPDAMIRQMLTCCGPVVSWKRVQGASGVLQAFGFCEFASPESALRAIRVLHDWQIMDKKLVVKVDAKTKTLLEEFKTKRVKEDQARSPKKEEEVTSEDPFFTEEMKREDEQVMRMVRKIVRDNEPAMLAMEIRKDPPKERSLPVPGVKTQERLLQLTQNDSGLSGANLEEEEKDFISKEIGRFREIMMRQEEEREIDRKKREAEREKRRSPESMGRRRRSPDSIRSSRSPSSRRRGTPDFRRRSRSRSRDKENRREDDEERERRKIDKRVREKELAYQERLRVWETRERKKSKEYEKEKKLERAKKSEETKLARRLKEFLEDYDDERDDPKYYKGRELERRRAERLREIEADNRDRQREKEELDELKSKIFAQGYENPDATYQKALMEMEEKYRPDILFKPEDLVPKMGAAKIADRVLSPSITINEDSQIGPSTPSSTGVPSVDIDETSQPPMSFSVSPSNVSSSPKGFSISPLTSAPATPASPVDKGEKRLTPSTSSTSLGNLQKKKKMDISEVFNTEEDEATATKKKKLTLLDDEPKPIKSEKVIDEKKKHVKSIIEKIPTSKEELFDYSIDWSLLDVSLIEKRIRPWINKKIVEYIGEPEPVLVEFICTKIMGHSSAQSILDDVQMVLDEEAEVFVVKMWRLLIYEMEARRVTHSK
ncbi:RNA-binding protein 25-like isoform X2 [Artemia franciscana]|uniref:RNA-binding protein 25 n=2 Tax=Artemia franciscana TaxID=6661 RepID=A0AA88KUS4_ARTSF|nr:hypothetical protein QYM36_015479 [Artemia franciscana]KAK2707803.1 hypothetical protein QYM36_015479 [Artemia franciscana]